jgi:hypothetical protein
MDDTFLMTWNKFPPIIRLGIHDIVLSTLALALHLLGRHLLSLPYVFPLPFLLFLSLFYFVFLTSPTIPIYPPVT